MSLSNIRREQKRGGGGARELIKEKATPKNVRGEDDKRIR
jgi:hypothetical protein